MIPSTSLSINPTLSPTHFCTTTSCSSSTPSCSYPSPLSLKVSVFNSYKIKPTGFCKKVQVRTQRKDLFVVKSDRESTNMTITEFREEEEEENPPLLADSESDSRPRRIALFVEPSPFAYVSGYKNRFQNFIKYLREMGDEVMVVTTHEGVPQEFYGAKLIGSRSFPCPWYQKVPLSLALSPRIISEVARFKPDIIHASSPGIMVFGALAIAIEFAINTQCRVEVGEKSRRAMAEENRARLAILELANMISVPMSLNAVVRLNVADAIWQGGSNTPLSASQILARVQPSSGGGDPENLQRILRMLTAYGVFNEHLDEDDVVAAEGASYGGSCQRKYSLTEIGRTLVTDSQGLSYAPYVLQHHQDALMRAWPLVDQAVLDPTTEPFVKANKEPAYHYYGKQPEMNELMLKAMSGVSVPFMKALLDGYDGFQGLETLVDVGGSAGDCLKMIIQKYPNIRHGINFDLPEVVAKAPTIPGVTHVGGDMFKSIPAGDAIFMKWILTTWTDDECKLIMENCFKALPAGGKVIACEPVLPKHSDDSHRTRALLQGDIFVMTIYRAKGKHRTEEEFRQLGLSVGFSQFKAFYIDHFYTTLEFQK